MYTLRLTQFTEDQDRYRVEVALEGKGLPRQTATGRFAFQLTPQARKICAGIWKTICKARMTPRPGLRRALSSA